MEYAVIRHGDMDSVVVFMKALDDGAVYFKNKAGTRQWIINLPTSNGRGGDIAFELRKQLRAKGLTAQADEINKAAQSLLSVIKHTDESSDDDEIIIDEGVEIIDAPYPENGKAQIPRRCFIYDDEDGYPEGYEGYIEHHGILGMKWGVRRYQNADGSLTDAGRKRYGVEAAKQKVENANGIREKKKVAATEVAKSAAGTTAGTGTAIAAGAVANYAMKHAWQINFLKDVVAAGTAGKIAGVTLTAREAAYVLAMEWGPMATILPALATPVGQLALGATAIAGVGMTAYNVYKGVKMAKVTSELNSEANRILDEASKKK